MLLVICATRPEVDAVLRGIARRAPTGGPGPVARGATELRLGPYEAVRQDGVTVLLGGIGPAAAAASTATALCLGGFTQVLCAGIAGGFDLAVGELVVASEIIHADLGADSAAGFLGADELGWPEQPPVTVPGAERLALRLGAVCGPVLTVSSVTGTEVRAASLRTRYRPAAEAMEGAGVATAAFRHGVPVWEVRAISNPVGARRRAEWDVPAALEALARAAARGFAPAFDGAGESTP
ncbi:MAG: futalosine hydrolase [Mycobacteriales bacterium]